MPRLLSAKGFGQAFPLVAFASLITATGCVLHRFIEDRAIGAMVSIRTAEQAFKSKHGRYGTLEELASSHSGIPSPTQYRYRFTVRATADSYIAFAQPIGPEKSYISLYLDHSGIIRGMFKNGGVANVKDPPLRSGINPQLNLKSPATGTQ